MQCPAEKEKIAEIGGEVQAVEASAGRKTYGRECRLEPVAGRIRAKVAAARDRSRANNETARVELIYCCQTEEEEDGEKRGRRFCSGGGRWSAADT